MTPPPPPHTHTHTHTLTQSIHSTLPSFYKLLYLKSPVFCDTENSKKILRIWEANGKLQNFTETMIFLNAKNVKNLYRKCSKKKHKNKAKTNKNNISIRQKSGPNLFAVFMRASVAMCFQYSALSPLYSVHCRLCVIIVHTWVE